MARTEIKKKRSYPLATHQLPESRQSAYNKIAKSRFNPQSHIFSVHMCVRSRSEHVHMMGPGRERKTVSEGKVAGNRVQNVLGEIEEQMIKQDIRCLS